ncbi:Rv3235 family protein [Pseudarthrobacter sp. TAF60_1]|uniref:Rv3235 family protein n=1 Tax=Pseudarthrobacter sp. TAF60_1 TaxID=3233071 RepID=UPI003F94C270
MNAVTPLRSAGANGAPTAVVRQVPLRAANAPGHQLRAADNDAEVLAIARSTVQAAMEVLAGIRPIHQLARRLDPRCLAVLQHRATLIRRELARSTSPTLARLHKNSVVRSVRACQVAPGIYARS